jgi:hypothetical protein
MSKINFLSQKLFSSASVSLVSQCQSRQPVPVSSVKRVFCQPFPVLQMKWRIAERSESQKMNQKQQRTRTIDAFVEREDTSSKKSIFRFQTQYSMIIWCFELLSTTWSKMREWKSTRLTSRSKIIRTKIMQKSRKSSKDAISRQKYDITWLFVKLFNFTTRRRSEKIFVDFFSTYQLSKSMRCWTTFVSFNRKRAINSSSNSSSNSRKQRMNRFVSSHLCKFAQSVEIRRKSKINKSALSAVKSSISTKKLLTWKRTNSMWNRERHDHKFVEKL